MFTVAITIYSALTFYLGWNIKVWLQSLNLFHWPFFYWPVLYIIAFSFIIGRLHKTLRSFSVVGNYWMFFFQYGLILFLITDIVMWLTPLENVAVIGSIVAGAFLLLFVVGTYNAYSPITKHLEMTIDKEGESLRLVVASDFHLGLLSNKAHLARFVKLSNEAKPDAVLLVGDLVDDDPIWFVEYGMSDVMKQLQSTYGVYGVLGNHEYYGGKIPQLVQEMKDANVRILMDETIQVDSAFYLTGQEDITNKQRAALSGLKPDELNLPWFIMNHTPNDLQTPTKAGADLHVSGHTHRGQMWPNNFITKRIFELDYGYKQKEQLHVLVSSGFGFWGPPTRIGSRSELWVIDVKFSK